MMDTWEPRPIPPVTPETRAFWEATAEQEFHIGGCESCGKAFYYPRAICPRCFADDVTLEPVDGTGSVYSYSVQYQVRDWPEEALPLVVAYVELEEGPRVVTNIVDCDADDVEIGAPVELTFIPTEDDELEMPVFTLA